MRHIYAVRFHIMNTSFDVKLYATERDALQHAGLARDNSALLKAIGIHAVSIVPLEVH
jgi:hypothetical protein